MRTICRTMLFALTLTSGLAIAQDRVIPDPAPAHPELRPVLIEDFGGMPGLLLLMDDFMQIMLDDPQLRPFFEHAEQDRIKRQLAEQFCVILGGDCVYSGRDMVESHEAHIITRADFNALVEALQVAMSNKGIPFRAQNKLLEKLAPMYREVETPRAMRPVD
jgi:hemoglobin